MWPAGTRTQPPDGQTQALFPLCTPLLSPVSGSTMLMVTMTTLLMLGVMPAPLMLWFLLGIVCAAVGLRVTRPEQFQDASQASGSFALSLLTGAPRSETASLLITPSHTGLLHLALLDRGWLAAGGAFLFGSPDNGNRLTEHDLAQLTTHIHEANCKHCNLSSYFYSRAPGLPARQLQAPAAAPHAATGSSSTASSQVALQFGASAAAGAGSAHQQQQQQLWSSSLQWGAYSGFSSSTGSSGGSNGAVAGLQVPTPALPPLSTLGPSHRPQYSYDDLDMSEFSRATEVPRMPSSSTAGSCSGPLQQTGLPVLSHSSSMSGGGWQPARAAATAGWLTSAEAAAAVPAQLRTSGGGSAATAVSAVTPRGVNSSSSPPSAAAAAAAAGVAAAGHWASSTTVTFTPAAAGFSAQHSIAQHGSLNQFGQPGPLKAWGSYTSMDSLDDTAPVCSICLGSYKPGSLVTGLPCGHLYHKDCVMPWLLQQGRKSTCPNCKAQVFA